MGQKEIAETLRGLADDIEDGRIQVTGCSFDHPTLSGKDQEWTLKFDDHGVIEWNREFWKAADGPMPGFLDV